MQALSAQTRTRNLTALANEHFDVLVIGGGITGAGVALDAVSRGYKVALVEKTDFASGTSSKSTKLVHGGIRYLPNFDIGLVHEALVERGLLLQNAPFLVKPVPFVLPLYAGDRHPVGMPFTTPNGVGLTQLLDLGLWAYDILAGRRNIKRHRHLSREAVLEMAPALLTEGLKEGFVYYDAQTHDARLTLALVRTAAQYGAIATNYSEVTSFIVEQDRIAGAVVHDKLGAQDVAIRAHHVVNATGIFSEQVEALLTTTTPQIQIEPSKGVHLVLAREDLQLGDAAIVLPETEDKRILFLVPWESRAIFGTTDTGTGDLDHPTTSQPDIAYLLKYLNRYLSVNLSEADIISTYAGYRPLVKPRNTSHSTARLSRTHVVLQSKAGLISIVGGKLTTYRRMAQDTVDVLSRRDGMPEVHPTQTLLLQGSAAWPRVQRELAQRSAALGLPSQINAHLGSSYGSEAHAILDLLEQDSTLAQPLIADLPYLRAEVLYACRHEMAMTPADVLARRTSIIMEDRQHGAGAVEEVATMMARELDWSPTERLAGVQTYRALLQSQEQAEHMLMPSPHSGS